MAAFPARFVALGGVWLDEIRTAGRKTKFDVLGGSVPFGKRMKILLFRADRSLQQLWERGFLRLQTRPAFA
jgi:hypothetical protein